jgi:hypothetical protein
MRTQFTLLSRLPHWTMAAMVLTMLFIGVAMVASLADYHALVSIHRPLGIAILILVVIRYVNRRVSSSAVSRQHAAPGAACGVGVGIASLRVDVHAAAGGMGNVVGSAVPDCAIWVATLASDSAAERGGVCGVAEGAHGACLHAVWDFFRSFDGGAISHVGFAGWDFESDGGVEGEGVRVTGESACPTLVLSFE